MNVLLVHRHDFGGGGGNIAMVRLHRGLRAAGVDSRILCGRSTRDRSTHVDGRGGSAESTEIPTSRVTGRIERVLSRLAHPLGLDDLPVLSTFRIPRLQEYREADVLDFHCTHGGFFNYLALPRLTRGKAAVLTLHDMWPFTGHCFYSLDCEKWKTGCGSCPHLDMGPPVERDASALEWRIKRWVYDRCRFHVVAPSEWMARMARRSILGRNPVSVIPNAVDLETFRPLSSAACRRELGIAEDRLVLMTAGLNLDDPRKGSDLLLEALRLLPEDLAERTTLLLMGKHAASLTRETSIETVATGYLTDPRAMVRTYGAADAFVHSSRADNHPLVLVESLACGLPMVAFRTGGVPELVRDEETGLLAAPEDPGSLAERLTRILCDSALRRTLSVNCRRRAEENHGRRLYVQRYIGVYQRALGRLPSGPPSPLDRRHSNPRNHKRETI